MATNFFDFREQMVAKPAAKTAPAAGDALTVSQLTAQIDAALKAGVPGRINVKGEVSQPKYHSAGHLYFTLKDNGACIDAVMWKSDLARVKFRVENGLELLVTGSIGLYAQRGRYQLYANKLSPVGSGALELAFRQLCAKLEAEGLFSPARKRPLPIYPRRIAIVTGRSTAALQDMLKVLGRFPFLQIFLYDVAVQGETAAAKISAAIRHLNESHASLGGIDLILLARGGGSMEELWSFNEEAVVRAIAGSSVPVVTGIGHETDTSISDLTADYHAHTPTEAASVVVRHWMKAGDLLAAAGGRLRNAARAIVSDARQRLIGIERHELFRRPTYQIDGYRRLMDDRQRRLEAVMGTRLRRLSRPVEEAARRLADHHPRHRVALTSQRVDELERRLRVAMTHGLSARSARLDGLLAQLRGISPIEVLKRGYSITTLKKDGVILRSADSLKGGERLVTRFAEGEVESVVQDRKQGTLFDS